MKTITILLALLLTFLSINCFAQNVNIPDANFKARLIAIGIDTNIDGQISISEAAIPTSLDVSGQNISNLTGIEAFVNLVNLNCSSNQISSINLSTNVALKELYCYSNQLTALNVSSNTALTDLSCFSNQLSSINLSNNTALKFFECPNNQITSLNVSNNTLLESLNCSANQLTSINLSANTALKSLYCNGNLFTSLNLSTNTALTEIHCYSNQLTTLDLSKNTALKGITGYSNLFTSLDVSKNLALENLNFTSNQISSINLSKNTSLKYLYCDNNPISTLDISKNTALLYIYIRNMASLGNVCVWELPFPPAGVTVDATGSPNVIYTTTCATAINSDLTKENFIKIVSNPAHENMSINSSEIKCFTVTISDLKGKIKYYNRIYQNNEIINISAFNKGLYIVVIKTNGQTLTKKLMI